MDPPQTPTPRNRRPFPSTQPIRSTRLYNLNPSSPVPSRLMPRAAFNSPYTTTASSSGGVENTDPRGVQGGPGQSNLVSSLNPGWLDLNTSDLWAQASAVGGINNASQLHQVATESQVEEGRETTAAGPSSAPNRFAQRAASQGLRPWNQDTFDDRWELDAEDLFQLDPGHHLGRGGSENPFSMADMSDQLRQNAVGGLSDQDQQPAEYPRPAVELAEVVRLNQLIHELVQENLYIASIYPYSEDAVRRMLYNRTFGDSAGAPDLLFEEASKMVIFGGRFVSRQTIRDEVLSVIEAILKDLIREPHIKASESQARLMEWLEASSMTEMSPLQPRAPQGERVPASTHFQSPPNTHDAGQSLSTEQATAAQSTRPRILHRQNVDVLGAQDQSIRSDNYGNTTQEQRRQAEHTGITDAENFSRPQQQTNVQPATFMPPMAAGVPAHYVTAGPVSSSVPFYPIPSIWQQQQQPPLYPQAHGFDQPAYSVMSPSFRGPTYPHLYQPPYYFQPYASAAAMDHSQLPVHMSPAPNYLGCNIPNPLLGAGRGISRTAGNVPNPILPLGHGNPVAVGRTTTTHPVMPSDNRQTHHPSRAARNRGFNVAAWAQENRPPTPVNTQVQSGPMPALAINPYRAGSDTMYPEQENGSPSVQLQNLNRQGAPNYNTMADSRNMPFGEIARDSEPAQWGVMRIGNIPYGLTKQEVVAFLGKNAKIVTPDLGSPIHIVMDRLTGKTMDCYVEFFSVGDAQAAVNAKTRLGHIHKLGDRVAGIDMATQDELLRQLFPKAKNVEWDSGVPRVLEPDEPYNTGFKGFVTQEEMVMLTKHAEFPQRSNYTTKCPQRTYESMISTLYKLPWHAPHLITLQTRNTIFSACKDQIRILVAILKKTTTNANWSTSYGATGLTHSLLEDLLLAGLNAPGFSERQRWELVETADWAGKKVRISPLAKWWPFEVVGRKQNKAEDVVQYYIDQLTRHLEPKDPKAPKTVNPFRTFSIGPLKWGLHTRLDAQGAEEMADIMKIFQFYLPKDE